MIDRVPPQNIEAEQAVLGAMMIDKEAISKATEILREEDFYRQDHRVVYQVIVKLFNKNQAVDMVTVTEVLKKEGKLEDVGGIQFITYLANAVPTAANVAYHAKIVEEKSLLRQLISVSTQIAGTGYEGTGDVNTLLDDAERMILAVSERKIHRDFAPIKDVVMNAVDRIDELYNKKGGITGLATGFVDFDRLTSGLQPSDLILIAARPSMGKTALVLNIAEHVAIREKKAVAIFSLEMSKEQLVQRMLCSEASIDSSRLRIGELEDKDWEQLIWAADSLSQAEIFIDDTPGISVMEMRAKARRLKVEHDLQLVVIDYLQLMQGSGKKNSENRQQELSDISRSLKALARELNVPIIALSQLSRSVESRQIKKPMLSDLRESGALEQDADMVAFLYREDYYDKETENKNITELIIAKHRNGPVDTVRLFFHKQFTRFANLAKTIE
ncbi:MAG TPA: replicative DNA helicase [Candidatus Avacidaminococcus intestinavium]|uniref:Replicative DNA helicase n=1 Tax=Candidatus Avacidaminococcus intestinavium TaxID=2840684 RepID=A0A9D1MRT8_9FIRM|nr:replicative DNA helicase [Candidatus Avacidaminococcus intestinavium]